MDPLQRKQSVFLTALNRKDSFRHDQFQSRASDAIWGVFFPGSYATAINLAYYPEPTAPHGTSYCYCRSTSQFNIYTICSTHPLYLPSEMTTPKQILTKLRDPTLLRLVLQSSFILPTFEVIIFHRKSPNIIHLFQFQMFWWCLINKTENSYCFELTPHFSKI